MGGANISSEQNAASDAFDFTGERAPVPRAPQMESVPAQIAAGVYNGAVAPTMDFMASPLGLATSAVPFAGQAASRIASAAFAPVAFGGMEEARQKANEVAKDPNATLQQKVEPIVEAASQGLMGIGAAKHAIPAPELGKLGITPKGRTAQSMDEIDRGLEEAAKPLPQKFPTSEQGFYSQLQKTIDEKMPNSSSVQQLMAIVDPAKGSGVKPDEIKWSNLESFLEGKDKVNKQDVLDYLRNEGAIKFENVERGDASSRKARDEYEALRLEDSENYKKRVSLSEKSYQANAEGNYDAAKQYDEEFKKLIDRSREIEQLKEKARNTYIDPKYAQYVVPGGENYREVILTLPSQKGTSNYSINDIKLIPQGNNWSFKTKDGIVSGRIPGNYTQEQAMNFALQMAQSSKSPAAKPTGPKSEYTSSHFSNVPDYVAHMRLNERSDADGAGLFIEELQSDRHQQGREKGYKEDAPKFDEAKVTITKTKDDAYPFAIYYDGKLLANPPLKVVSNEKQAKEMAVETYESGRLFGDSTSRVADAPFRKDWSVQLFKRALQDAVNNGKDWIGWTSGESQAERYDLSKQVEKISYKKNNDGTYHVQALGRGQQMGMALDDNFSADKLPDIVGKEIAQKIINGEGVKNPPKSIEPERTILSGVDLKVGGEGMKGFYDQILPKEIGKYVKKWGAKVEEGGIGERADNATWKVEYPNGRRGTVYSEDAAESAREEGAKVTPSETKRTPIWKIKITPEMRKLIKEGGQPQVYNNLKPVPRIA